MTKMIDEARATLLMLKAAPASIRSAHKECFSAAYGVEYAAENMKNLKLRKQREAAGLGKNDKEREAILAELLSQSQEWLTAHAEAELARIKHEEALLRYEEALNSFKAMQAITRLLTMGDEE